MVEDNHSVESEESLTEEELRDAGASGAYITYYKTAKRMGETTASTRHAERVVNDGVNYSGGGFHESLWNDDPRFSGDNPYGADSQNKKILREADIYQSAEGLIA